MNILLLDDNQHRITYFQNGLKAHKLTVCRHAQAAKNALKASSFDIMFLDHDLEGEPVDSDDENTGSEVARFIAEHQIPCKQIILHTENRAGRQAMKAILGQAQSVPYSTLKKTGFHSILKAAKESSS